MKYKNLHIEEDIEDLELKDYLTRIHSKCHGDERPDDKCEFYKIDKRLNLDYLMDLGSKICRNGKAIQDAETYIDKEIFKYYPNVKLKIIDKILNGAVLTCLEGIELIDNDNPVLFNDCDHAFLCNSFYEYCKTKDFNDNEIDGALLTFNSNEDKYSYIALDEKENVIQTVEKKVISDKAICGAYYFKNKYIFKNSADKYLNNCNYEEYFISGLYNVMAENKMIIKYFLTDLHISFGTPEEYRNIKNYNFNKFI